MKLASAIFLAAFALSGCAQNNVAQRDGDKRHVGYVAQRPDYFKERRTITGSNIPIAPGQLPSAGPVFATSPSQGVARERPSLYPTEPVVGATPNTEPGTAPVNVGAGPAGSNPVPGDN